MKILHPEVFLAIFLTIGLFSCDSPSRPENPTKQLSHESRSTEDDPAISLGQKYLHSLQELSEAQTYDYLSAESKVRTDICMAAKEKYDQVATKETRAKFRKYSLELSRRAGNLSIARDEIRIRGNLRKSGANRILPSHFPNATDAEMDATVERLEAELAAMQGLTWEEFLKRD